MNIPITLSVHASEKFSSKKDGKSYVKITGTGAGIGLFNSLFPKKEYPILLRARSSRPTLSFMSVVIFP